MRYTNILVYTKKHRLGLPFHKVTPLVTTIHYNPFGYVWWWQVCRLYEVIRCSCHVRGGSRLTSHEGVYGFRTWLSIRNLVIMCKRYESGSGWS